MKLAYTPLTPVEVSLEVGATCLMERTPRACIYGTKGWDMLATNICQLYLSMNQCWEYQSSTRLAMFCVWTMLACEIDESKTSRHSDISYI